MLNLLRVLQHGDSAFPSGSFAFSNGVEGLIMLGASLNEGGLDAAVTMMLHHRWASADRVALVHGHRAGNDCTAIATCDRALEAATLSEPLRTGSRRNGMALLTAHARLGTPGAVALRDAVRAGHTPGHLAVVQGHLWRTLGMSESNAVAVSGYAATANMITAAVRLGRIGAVAGQRVLANALAVIAGYAEEMIAEDTPIASYTPWLDIAAVRQTRADLKLFAN